MKHLSLELEKLEERIATWGPPSCGGTGSKASHASKASHKSTPASGRENSKGAGSKEGSKGAGSKDACAV